MDSADTRQEGPVMRGMGQGGMVLRTGTRRKGTEESDKEKWY